jgi:Alw26I/Eco31I/Esp3I family type II restriction m6 adenine DNA methyltransferase
MPAPRAIQELVRRFRDHMVDYKSGDYNEAEFRSDFIEPMFEALGWDMTGPAGLAEHHEKFSVGFPQTPSAAFRLRCYAWSAKIPLAVFVGLEGFSVYDCRFRPNQMDRASRARIFYVKLGEYLSRWDEIERLFSKRAVQSGAKRGHVRVDDEFLAEIENWRELLAPNIALRNPDLDQRQINFAVQRVIDRIIFLRFCEDRGIEESGRLKALLGGKNSYKRMIPILREADSKYNIGLFDLPKEKGQTTEPGRISYGLDIDDKVIKAILKTVYDEGCPYEFSVFPSDILGQVYERFLGKVIRLSAGIFYTPSYVVNYIVKNTIGSLLVNKTPQQVARLKICDPACGSGSFLLGAYQFMLDWHRDYYEKKGNKKQRGLIGRGRGGRPRLVTQERKRILLNNICGVDIDSQAVEVTKLSLFLKVLEGENEDTCQGRLLPPCEHVLLDLGGNIKCGDSLIDEKTEEGVNAFLWEKEFAQVFLRPRPGFDAIIGNPPYDVLEKDKNKASSPHRVLREYGKRKKGYEAALGGKLNLYRFFVVRSIQLTRDNGRYGMIVPLSLLTDISCRNARKYLLAKTHHLNADCFPQKDNPHRRIFPAAKISTVIVTATRLARSLNDASITVTTYPGNSFDDEYKRCVVKYSDSQMLSPKNSPIPLLDEDTWTLCKKIHNAPGVRRLGECSSDVIVHRGEINQTIYRDFIEDNPRHKRLVKGVEIGRYVQRVRLSQGKKEWFNEQRFLKENTFRPITKRRRIATQRITGVDEKLRVVATIIEPQAYFADSTNSIHLKCESRYCLEYVAGIFNSKLMQWRFKLTSANNNVGTNEIESLPFRQINFDKESDRARHDEIVIRVKKVIELHKSYADAHTPHLLTSLKRRIGECLSTIDDRVFELYGLSSDEQQTVRNTQDY